MSPPKLPPLPLLARLKDIALPSRRAVLAALGGVVLLVVFAVVIRSVGGADMDFKQARHLEERGEVLRAIDAFKGFLASYPGDPRVAEAACRAGRLYAEALERCPEAVGLFERAARTERLPWSESARLGLLSCPDFFPLRKGGSWVYVDTLSGGRNMRLELGVRTSSAGVSGRITGSFFAGTEKFRDYDRGYEKRGWAIWESEGGAAAPILKYPFTAGRKWEHRGPSGRLRYRIVADGLRVRVKAGRFEGCVKVREKIKGARSWVFNYYCPGVGRVKTTIGVPGVENPNTELASYSVSAD